MRDKPAAMVIKENIQVALKLIDGSDLSSCVARERLEESLTLLEDSIQVGSVNPADETLSGGPFSARQNARGQKIGFPLTVWFRKTKEDQWFQGALEFADDALSIILRFNKQVFYSPSKAACTLAGNSRDGWRDIYYDDRESGRRLPISTLKERGLLSRKDFSR